MPREKESEHKNIFICFLCRPEKIVRREGKVKKKKTGRHVSVKRSCWQFVSVHDSRFEKCRRLLHSFSFLVRATRMCAVTIPMES